MTKLEDTIRVVIPLTIRKRNGRSKILPPQGVHDQEVRSQDPHILKALGRAWAWRRKLECGEVATAGELAKMEGVTERFVSRTMRLAYLSPDVLARIVMTHVPPAIALPNLIAAANSPWLHQFESIFNYSSDEDDHML